MPADDYSSDINTTGAISMNSSVTGNIETQYDTDWFRVSLFGGGTYALNLEGTYTGAGTLSDPYIRGIYDSTGFFINGTTDDDDGYGLNSFLEFTTASSGDYFISAGAFTSHTGTYTLSIDAIAIEGVTITGGSGSDIIDETQTVDGQPLPTYGADFIDGRSGRDTIDGLGGDDEILGGSNNDTLTGGYGDDILRGESGKDILNGDEGDDILEGGSGSDILYGGEGDDILDGGSNKDILDGGTGENILTGGSAKDTFVFSEIGAMDTITDFKRDYIDITAIDANINQEGNQAFRWYGEDTDVMANGVTWFEDEANNTIVQADVDGDSVADMSITLLGTNLGLSEDNFIGIDIFLVAT